MSAEAENDPMRAAAHACLALDYRAAVEAVRDLWVQSAMPGYEPYSADEDGRYFVHPDGAFYSVIPDISESVRSELWEILEPAVGAAFAESTAATHAARLERELRASTSDVADDALEDWRDDHAYSVDPSGYYGV